MEASSTTAEVLDSALNRGASLSQSVTFTIIKTVVAYYRTSSASNVGPDKDSLERQRAAVAACAASQGLRIVQLH